MLRTAAMLILFLSIFPFEAQAQIWTGTCACHYNESQNPATPFSCDWDVELTAPTYQYLYSSCQNTSKNHGTLSSAKGEMPKKVAEGPPISFCVPLNPSSARAWSPVYELFGEQTGNVPACILTKPGERVSAVYCYMGQGTVKQSPPDKLTAPGCYKFDTTDGCDIGYAALHGPLYNYITDKDQQLVCVWGEAQSDTGSRYFGIVGGDPADTKKKLSR